MTGLSLSLLLVGGLLTWSFLRDDPYVAPQPAAPERRAPAGSASQVLATLERAVEDEDVAAAAALAPAADVRARRLLTGLVRTAARAQVTGFSARYVDEIGAVTDEGWSAAVDVTWAFDPHDEAAARAEVRFRFARHGDQVRLSRIGGGGLRSPVWMTGPVEVRRGGGALVLAAGSAATADRYARLAQEAVPAVREVLARWRGGLVVEVPGGVAALHRALDAKPGTYSDIAAVTTTGGGAPTGDASAHVFVNPRVFGSLRPRGAQVVMTHEAVHVATDATTSPMPLWLLEGFADYVALRDVDLPITVTAGQVLRQVRRDGPPRRLPGPDEFDTATPHLGASYEAAWLACRLLAQEGGERALVRLYQRVRAGRGLDAVLRSEFGFGSAGLVRRWRGLLQDLAG